MGAIATLRMFPTLRFGPWPVTWESRMSRYREAVQGQNNTQSACLLDPALGIAIGSVGLIGTLPYRVLSLAPRPTQLVWP